MTVFAAAILRLQKSISPLDGFDGVFHIFIRFR